LTGFDPYGGDVLSGDWRGRGKKVVREVEARKELIVELPDGFVGAVVGVEKGNVGLEDRHGRVRWFPLGRGYLVDGTAVVLIAPKAAPQGTLLTASGSRAVADQRARVARASRIYVEGRHDAELVEKVWGADLRVEGVVVEYLEGIDNLAEVLAERRPGADARIGVLVDHLVPGSKESRIASQVTGEHVLVVGHPFIDVWQGVRPERIGIRAWPVVPRGTDWKHGVCEALGWPHDDQADIAAAWKRILASVRTYADLEPSLLGRVEQLIDFVTAPGE
jgi:hypothetical protein